MTRSSIQSVSSNRRKWKYDVFVSFRGEDTRNNFTDHLFGALHKNRIVVFRDDINLKKGGNISSELLQAIKESHILIVIFSKNYASSTWCLQELVNIADCIHVQGQTVLPIFYDVSPSEVRKQTGDYEKPFLEHGERFKGNLEAVQRWRGALTQVANLSGWDIKDKSQYAEIEKIIKKVRSLLGNKTETLTGDIVGMHSQVEELQNFLIDKSFITSEMGRICMHDLFKELGKSIVREKSMKEPRKWNWLWDYKDVHNVISENMVK
ncbi:disease resistance protein (TIR-NBS-LRR class), putative [Medicago truncatula]|uniref:Disease resistance protein (TIR-NBS-LRR class), putative n=1 Tax=Medicago truncatula TaxID=3880 RepID=G7LIZ9_MEDTR|nr:disease resistance protein (TIR-NBS-LRR class), putative [Medicago truncatula]